MLDPLSPGDTDPGRDPRELLPGAHAAITVPPSLNPLRAPTYPLGSPNAEAQRPRHSSASPRSPAPPGFHCSAVSPPPQAAGGAPPGVQERPRTHGHRPRPLQLLLRELRPTSTAGHRRRRPARPHSSNSGLGEHRWNLLVLFLSLLSAVVHPNCPGTPRRQELPHRAAITVTLGVQSLPVPHLGRQCVPNATTVSPDPNPGCFDLWMAGNGKVRRAPRGAAAEQRAPVRSAAAAAATQAPPPDPK